MTLVWNWSP